MGKPETSFEKGDKVKLTDEKIEDLERTNQMVGFPEIDGIVDMVSGSVMAVRFGHSIRMVAKSDVEKLDK